MSLHPSTLPPVPEETARIAKLAFPNGNRYLTLRDQVGTFFNDSDFKDLFSVYGQSAISPCQLALICIMQFLEDLTDRQAAEAVRSRIDWKYLLGLRQTRYTGLAKTHLQHVFTAIAMNFARIVSWLKAEPLPKLRVSRFAALAPA